ncbi:MAG: dickkopf-related protein [Myxococcota bacterium]
MNGICQLAACPAGDIGCACINGDGCDAGGVCVDGLCKAQECIPGTEGCDCLAGGCRVGLTCSQNVCIDQSGRIGGACLSDGTCADNARCDTTQHPSVCVFCELGTIGCQCDADSCLPGLSCMNGHCSGDPEIQSRTIPANPVCHTPCQSDVTLDDGTTLTCESNGLLEGCLDGRTCQNGECIAEGEERRICLADAHCPSFMQCIQGYCYSNCEADADCDDGMGCHLTVCRKRCATNSNDCPDTMLCDAPDTELGYCMPRTSETGENVSSPQGTWALGTDALRFDPTTDELQVRIINDSQEPLEVMVSKIDHTLVRSDASKDLKHLANVPNCTSVNCPLWWLEMGVSGFITQGTTSQVLVPPRCIDNNSCPRFTVRIAPPGVDAVRWRGNLRFESKLGTRSVALSYAASPEGQWSGKMVYFANFDETGIDSIGEGAGRRIGWLDRDRSNVGGTAANEIEVANALIKQWEAFRNGGLSGGWEAMSAILSSTETEQWRWPSVKEDCVSQEGACYLYNSGSTGSLPIPYTTNLADEPIPAGSTVFPMAFNLYIPEETSPHVLEGRIVSEAALHYPGNPFVRLQFEADPSDESNCTRIGNHCVNFLQTKVAEGDDDGLTLSVSIGARHVGGSCDTPGFERRLIPWLVPGFDNGTTDVGGFAKRELCVDTRLPAYTDTTPEAVIENRSLARGNPIPDGEVIRRTVKLLDGAMIDQSRIFLLFRESYPSFLGGEDFHAYGYLLLERRGVQIDRADEDGDGVPDEFEGAQAPPLEGSNPASAVHCPR